MNKLTVGDVEIEMIKDGVIWRRISNGLEFEMDEPEIIPIVNATAELYEAVLRSQLKKVNKKLEGK